MEKEVKVAQEIALKAGEIMLKYFDSDQQVVKKSDNSPVTIADTEINELVIKELMREFPQDGIIGEERSISKFGDGRIWFCDPIDGTAGYIWGTPTAMFSLALVIDGEPVMGVAYDPFLKRMYCGIKGQGSFCNDVKLSVSDKDLQTGILSVTGSVALALDLPYLRVLKDRGSKMATFSGAVYKACLVAKGKFTGYIEHGVNPHDMAAVQVIVEEAGGKITSLKGEKLDYRTPFKGAITSNGLIHEELVDLVNN